MSADPTAPESGVMPGDGQSSHEIERRTEQAVQVMPLMSDDEIRRTWRVAQALAASRMFKDSAQAEQAFAKILLGRDLGLSPTQAMTGIHIVEGKPEIAATTLASFVRRREDMRYEVVEHTDEACEIHFYGVLGARGDLARVHHAQSCQAYDEASPGSVEIGCACKPSREYDGEMFLGASRFTNEDVKRAGLDEPTRNGHPSNHTKYPRNMKFARAMSNGIKWFVPEATGGIPVYHEGEVPRELPATAAATGADPAQLPEVLAQLLERTQQVDPHAWRQNEILARLPHPNAAEYVPTVDGIVAEMQQWLTEHEVPEAEAVPDSEGTEVLAGEPEEVRAAVDKRYREDEDFRSKVDPLLNRMADLEAVAESEVSDQQWQDIGTELDQIADGLDALGVPRGWLPSDEPVEA